MRHRLDAETVGVGLDHGGAFGRRGAAAQGLPVSRERAEVDGEGAAGLRRGRAVLFDDAGIDRRGGFDEIDRGHGQGLTVRARRVHRGTPRSDQANVAASGAGRPRIMSEALSAIIKVEALRLAEIMRGMIEASTTRRPSRP